MKIKEINAPVLMCYKQFFFTVKTITRFISYFNVLKNIIFISAVHTSDTKVRMSLFHILASPTLINFVDEDKCL